MNKDIVHDIESGTESLPVVLNKVSLVTVHGAGSAIGLHYPLTVVLNLETCCAVHGPD